MKEMVDSGGMWRFRTTYLQFTCKQSRSWYQRKEKENPKAIIRRVLHKIYKQHKTASEHIGTAQTTFIVRRFSADTTNPIFAVWGFRPPLYRESRTNILTQNPECLYMIGALFRTNRNGQRSAFFQNILKQ